MSEFVGGSLAEMLAEMREAVTESDVAAPAESPLSHEEQIVLIKDYHKRYEARFSGTRRFAPGDLVTPIEGSIYTNPGAPCIVLETSLKSEPQFNAATSPGMPSYGARYDMRVAYIAYKNAGPVWVESHDFIAYTPPVESEAA